MLGSKTFLSKVNSIEDSSTLIGFVLFEFLLICIFTVFFWKADPVLMILAHR